VFQPSGCCLVKLDKVDVLASLAFGCCLHFIRLWMGASISWRYPYVILSKYQLFYLKLLCPAVSQRTKQQGMNTPIRCKDFLFHPEVGELIWFKKSEREKVERLAPQPCQLLVLLLKNYPKIVSREEIRQSLWPEVRVDFDRSLHFCIRQIRAALNDDAAHPKFIETIPRRGYRWIADFEVVDASSGTEKAGEAANLNPQDKEPGDARPEAVRPAHSRMLPPLIWKIGLGFALLALILLYSMNHWRGKLAVASENDSPKLRLAIMPFQPANASHPFAGNDIALQLLQAFGNKDDIALEVIGPTTTAQYHPDQFQALAKDYRIDWILNGRFSQAADSTRLLAEVIRAGDGAHVWVKYFDPATPVEVIVERIADGFFKQFGLQEMKTGAKR
jgi:DNA-binding winged helix-turn-helix (wHTH) protein/TolB-like protein